MAQRAYGIYMSTPPTLSDGEIHPILLDASGRLITAPNSDESASQTIIYADLPAEATAAGVAEEVLAAVATKKFYILELVLTFTVQDVVRLLDKSGTPNYHGSYQVPAYGSIGLMRNADDKPHFVTTAGENLGIVTAAINSYSGHILYYNAA